MVCLFKHLSSTLHCVQCETLLISNLYGNTSKQKYRSIQEKFLIGEKYVALSSGSLDKTKTLHSFFPHVRFRLKMFR